jgi:hypothetical protein
MLLGVDAGTLSGPEPGRLGPDRRAGRCDDHPSSAGIEPLWPDRRRVGHGGVEVDARQVRPGKVRAAKIRLLQTCSWQMRPRQVGAGEIGATQVGVVEADMRLWLSRAVLGGWRRTEPVGLLLERRAARGLARADSRYYTPRWRMSSRKSSSPRRT